LIDRETGNDGFEYQAEVYSNWGHSKNSQLAACFAATGRIAKKVDIEEEIINWGIE